MNKRKEKYFTNDNGITIHRSFPFVTYMFGGDVVISQSYIKNIDSNKFFKLKNK